MRVLPKWEGACKIGAHLVIDFETRGVDPMDPEFGVVGFALAWKEGEVYRSGYVDISSKINESRSILASLLACLASYPLVAHNVNFDAGCSYWALGYHLNWKYCTYGLFRQLASEGFNGQSWSLETAEMTLLGWPDSNKWELEEWLINQGHYTYTGVGDRKKKTGKKSEMWRAPADVMGVYSSADALATLQLLELVLLPAMNGLDSWLPEYHSEIFINEVKLLVEQQFKGMLLDVEQMTTYRAQIEKQLQDVTDAFLTHPSVLKHINDFNESMRISSIGEEPKKYKKQTEKEIKEGRPKIITKRWEQWRQKCALAKATQYFNPQSTEHLRWLFYEKMKFPIIVKTDTGKPSVDDKASRGFGEVGKLLHARQKLNKELGYIDAMLGFHRNGTMHLQFKAPGTLTGRLAGKGGVNFQQLSKTEGFLTPLKARPGHSWIGMDFSALEPRVLTELSEDPTMMELYGPNAKPFTDVYLWNGAHIRAFSDKIRKYYNPDRPTAEQLKVAKHECKKERSVLKTVTLAKNYNAGVGKIYQTLVLDGMDVSYEEVEEICSDYDSLYVGIRKFGRKLEREWNDRGGWVYSGLGLPTPVAPEYTKDLVNRVVQRTGHDILQLFLRLLQDIREDEKLVGWPVMVDTHDETRWEVPDSEVQKWKAAFQLAMDRLNEWLGGKVKLSGEFGVHKNAWEIKGE